MNGMDEGLGGTEEAIEGYGSPSRVPGNGFSSDSRSLAEKADAVSADAGLPGGGRKSRKAPQRAPSKLFHRGASACLR